MIIEEITSMIFVALILTYILPALWWFYAWCSRKASEQRFEAIRAERALTNYKRRIRLGMEL